jgi:hypothetical protein
MLSDLDVSTHSDTSNGNYNVEPNLWQRNQSEVEPETEQPFPESPQPLFRTSLQQKEHEESKSIVQFIQHHIDTCSSSTCLRQLVTTAEKRIVTILVWCAQSKIVAALLIRASMMVAKRQEIPEMITCARYCEVNMFTV